MYVDIRSVDVIAPNFKKRLSGVTSTIIQLVPYQRQAGLAIAALGPGLPESVPKIRFRDLWRLWIRPRSGKMRVWHARRNVEMLPGIIMRDVLRMPVKLVFTSASQRNHSAYTKLLIRQMDHVIATSAKTASYLTVSHTVIMHGIDTAKFFPADTIELAKQNVGLPPDKFVAGCFGRIRRQKGTDLFVDAMIAVLPDQPHWIAIIAGRTTTEHVVFENQLRSRIRDAGLQDRILFVGEHSQIAKWYQALDLYIAPQRWEGFGLTPLEAMATGVAVIATDAGAFRELVAEGLTGNIVAPNDLSQLIKAVTNLMKSPELITSYGHNGLERARTLFPLHTEVAALDAVYRSLM